MTLWFNPVGADKAARVMKRVRTNAQGEFRTRMHMHKPGSVFATVAQNGTQLAARSHVYKVRLVKKGS